MKRKHTIPERKRIAKVYEMFGRAPLQAVASERAKQKRKRNQFRRAPR